MSIYIFSRPVHSGKTTELLQWCSRQKDIQGILMPDMNGSRKILNIGTKEVFDIECTDPGNCNESLTMVGRFNFYTAAFEKANAILFDAISENPGWLVIDEAGKLELGGKGFYSSISKAISVYDREPRNGNLLLTVRDSLCNEVIDFFGLQHYIVITLLEELPG